MVAKTEMRRLYYYNPTTTLSFNTFAASILHIEEQHIHRPIATNPQLTKESIFKFQDRYNFDHASSQSSASNHSGTTALPETHSSFSALFSGKYSYLVEKYRFLIPVNDAKHLHLEIVKNGYSQELFLCNYLIHLYVKNGDMAAARDLFDEMPDRNAITWASLITGYAKNYMPNEACESLRQMVRSGLVPNHYSFGSALRACQSLGACGLRLGMQIHALVLKTCYLIDEVICNVLISMYRCCGDPGEYAWSVFCGIEAKDSVSWNSIISFYSQRGDSASAFKLFSFMQNESMEFYSKPTEETFGSLISAAASHGNCGLLLLEQVLGRIEKSGFLKDLYVGSALVCSFGRFGCLDTALKIFKQMGMRNVVSMNGLMVGLIQLKRGEDAAKVFIETRDMVEINYSSFVVLLSAFPEFSLLEEGKQRGKEVHAYVLRTGLYDSKVAIGNGLINMYAKCGAIEEARSVFNLMIDKDLTSWNSLISGLDRNECFEDAVWGFRTMRSIGMMPSNFNLISALSSCGSLGWIKMGSGIHCDAIKLGLDLDVSVSNALLALYADVRFICECRKIFSLMPERDRVSWNSIIGALSDSEASIFESIEYFIEMMRAGWRLNRVTFINVLSAVSSLSLLGLASQIHALVLKYNAMDDVAIENAFLTCYGKCGQMDDCEKIFSRMSDRRDDVSWNSMISSYIHNELLTKAMGLIWLMLHNGQRLDCFTFSTVLSARASVATLERGMEVHACGIRACLESDVFVGSALVDMYSKCGRIDYASRFFKLMPERNVYSWNSMISGYARHGHGHEALEVFRKMKLEGQPPDHVTFVAVLSACSHIGLVEQGFDHFESMSRVYDLTPRIEHFSCMVDLLGRAGELDKMEDFIQTMPLRPNALIWRTVLGVCSRASGRKRDLGRKAAKMLMELEPQNAVNYVLLANMHASGGKWEDVAQARRSMREATARKEKGCSWVSMRDGIHVFVAGDKSHPDTDAIYENLRELHKTMKLVGDPELEDHRMMSQYLPLLREIMPSAAEEISLTYMTIFSSEAKADGFLPGGASLHCCTTPHGPDTKTYEKTIALGNEARPHRITGTMARAPSVSMGAGIALHG
nr:putative pentatricopeptide repeat-containing protein At5g09950 [Ipomoea batatas]